MIRSNPPVLPENPAAQHGGSDGLSSSTVVDDNNVANGRQGMHTGEEQFDLSVFEQDSFSDTHSWLDSLIIDYQHSDMVQNVTPEREEKVSPQYNQQATGSQQIEDILAPNTHPQAPSINNNGNSGSFGGQSMVGNPTLGLTQNSYQPSGLNGEAMALLHQQQPAIVCHQHQHLTDLSSANTAGDKTISMGNMQHYLNEDLYVPVPHTQLQDCSINTYGISGVEHIILVDEAGNPTTPIDFQAMLEIAMDGESQMANWRTQGQQIHEGSTNDEETFTPNNEMENSRIQDLRISQGLSEGHDIFPSSTNDEETLTPNNEIANSRIQDPRISEGLSEDHDIFPSRTCRRKNTPWTKREVNSLLEGVDEYGTSRWTGIRERYFAESTRTPKDLKDKYKNLTKMANNQNRILRGARLSEDVFNWVLRLNEKYGKASS